jgi:hypothetical protein
MPGWLELLARNVELWNYVHLLTTTAQESILTFPQEQLGKLTPPLLSFFFNRAMFVLD